MAPKPIGNNAQVHPLTTALKNICRDYPAGGGVLRELLQNADDAGATSVRFLLDEKAHPTDEMIHEKLGQYQGPALLAYNNAEFTSQDFENLSQIGNSQKIHDGSTTGRFGRGFNSVYNWTDSPSIVSRERLLILDPHYEWSSGGPVYNFVEDSDDAAIKNHMAAFQDVIETPSQQLNGTVIRIPLRTAAQARKSQISNRETTVSEMRKVLSSFATEFENYGLLFMKNVGKLEATAKDLVICIEVVDGDAVRLHKLKINEAVKQALKDPGYSFSHCFELGIECKSSGVLKNKTTFVVHHRIHGDSMKRELREWAADQKLVPWVAVASQVIPNPAPDAKGLFFTVLPLPILNSQPVHIHGLFSISPDRARLYQLSGRDAQDQTPAKWNDFLFQGVVPVAWAALLTHLAGVYPEQSTFNHWQHWPQGCNDPRDVLSKALFNVLKLVENKSLVVWPTVAGYVAAKDGLLATSVISTALKDALLESKAPVVYCPQELQHKAKDLFEDRVLSPLTLCRFLRSDSRRIRQWSDQTKLTILDHLLSQSGFIGYHGLEIFPFEDGVYRAIGGDTTFLHRDELEKDLFYHEKSRNLDLQKLTEATQRSLRRGRDTCIIHPSIQYRSASSLKDYCMNIIFKDLPQDQDMVELSPELSSIVSQVWAWISQRAISILDDEVSCLWLFPLSNGHYRRIRPPVSTSIAYLAPPGELGKLMWKFDSKASKKPKPLLSTIPAGEKPLWLPMLTSNRKLMTQLSIEDASDIVTFLQWLRQSSPSEVVDEDRFMIAKLISMHLPPTYSAAERTAILEVVCHLKVFQRVSWTLSGKKMVSALSWTNLKSCAKSIGLLEGIIPVPQLADTQFLVADPSSSSHKLLQNLELAKCLGSVEIIQDYVIPAWERGEASKWSSNSKEQMAEFILHNFSRLPLPLQARLRKVPFVPVAQLDGKNTSQFAVAEDLIDPENLELKGLYFGEECITPKQRFLREFNAALKACGLKTGVDESVVEQRVRHYSNSRFSLLDTINHAERLLRSTCRWISPSNKQQNPIIRHAAWLPATDIKGTLSLKSSDKCRSFSDRFLVSSQLPTLRFSISTEWNVRLGWDAPLPSEILLPQLDFGIEKGNRRIIDAVLNYISRMDIVEQLKDGLKGLPCVVANNGLLIKPALAFHPYRPPSTGCDRLQPYLANVEPNFWQEHNALLVKLGVRDLPQISDLLEVQKILEGKANLDESDISVAIEILNHAARFPRDALTNLKVISATGTFEPVENINFNDLGPQKPKQEVILTHPDISLRTIQKLGIVGLRELLIKRMLDIEDVGDEDEFEQQEDVTTRIRDTLERYPVEATFREYLANADDATGVTRLSWLVDSRCHPYENLLTPEMKNLQGPALLVHNDGTFSENDFEGFKRVGQGSKSQNKEAIGQFGRGSQTMYHWTDTPMILSGKHLVILDPQKTMLPTNKFRGTRMPGVKLLLSKLRETCPDQLASFEGLWDYTQGLDDYPGTIFRFPLRTKDTVSDLKPIKIELDVYEIRRLMENYFREARISLLFLRKIKSIGFSIIDESRSSWSVVRQPPVDEDAKKLFSELVICSIRKNTDSGTEITGKDKWWVVIQDLDPEAENSHSGSRRALKNAECGLAALLSSSFVNNHPIQPRMFNTLPLPINSDLPVHVHATFSLSGDRQSIAIGEYGAQSHASSNRFYLQDALPKLYLQFLEDIGRQIRQDVFQHWPQEKPPKESPSELLCASFWEMLPKSSRQLFPKARVIEERPKRQAANLFTFSDAVFDFLPETDSEILFPLLMSLDVNLVRKIPKQVAKRLKEMSDINTISGPRLRQLFKSKESGQYLQKQIAQGPSTFKVLIYQLTPAANSLKELDACYLLPLADGNITTLRYLNDNSEGPKYYVVNDKQLKLFQFASGHLVTSAVATQLGPVLKSGKFNLEELGIHHVKQLLELKPIVTTPNPEADRWLVDFWEFWNEDLPTSLTSTDLNSFVFPLFRATRNGEDTYATLSQFKDLPAVTKPSISEHQQICSKIPGLYIFDPEFMPQTLANDERSFHKKNSYFRLIRAMHILTTPHEISTFVHSNLNSSDKKVLQNLAISHILAGALGRNPMISSGYRTDLQSIPIWPSITGGLTEQSLCAETAFMVSNDALLVPWMRERYRFIDPQFTKNSNNQTCLLRLGAKMLSVDVLLESHVLPLPQTLDGSNWRHFKTLVGAISGILPQQTFTSTGFSLLKQSRIAADGNGILKKACELFDHETTIFKHAFRRERSSRFLHDEMAVWRSFWIKIGLRHQSGFLEAADYLECLRAIANRLRNQAVVIDPYLEEDCREVLSELITSDPSTFWFTPADWQAFSRERVFPSRRVFNAEPEFRRDGMAAVASKDDVLCLSEIISYDHVSVCWSQTPFSVHQPTTEVLSHVLGNGRPDVSMVWQHLQYMRDLCEHLKQYQIKDFLADLHLTYSYLQDRLKESSATFIGKDQAIWLNLDSLDYRDLTLTDIRSCWCRTDNLVLSSTCDAEPMKAVRPNLMRYEKLLKALGCAFVFHPIVKRPEPGPGYSVCESLRKLRSDGKMLDVTYSSEGKLIRAHRVVLAAASEMCAAQFSGLWKLEDVIKYDEDDDADNFLSYPTLSTMINYAYGDETNWGEMEISEHDSTDELEVKLDMLLNLLKGADYWFMPELKSQVEDKILMAGKPFRTLHNIVKVWEQATQARADGVVKMCAEFIEQNENLLKMIYDEERIKEIILENRTV